MNRLMDGTGWILPPRCASRWTASLLWKYGLEIFSEHGIDPSIEVEKVVMNIRHPISRFGSWFRLMKSREGLPEVMSSMSIGDYIENLVTAEYNPVFTVNLRKENYANFIAEKYAPTDVLYPVPLYRYVEILGRTPDHFVRVEHLEEDLEAAGYPIQDHEAPREKEAQLDFSYDDLVENDRWYNIIMAIYHKDLKLGNYD